MEEEIKKAYMDWSEKGVSYLNCMYVYDTMMDVDEALQTCDTILDEIDLGIDYTSRKKDIDRLLEGHGTLHRYIDVLNCYVDDKLDQPLKKDFKKNATETISRIHLEDFEVDNTLGLTENNYITGGMGYAGTMVEQEKAKLTFADFIGTSDGKADGNGLHMAYTNGSVEDFASIFAAQYEAMKASGALGEDNNLTQQEFLEQFYRQGEFTHDSSNPFLNFVSSVLDITIIKPVIESCIGEDLITGEDLTDMERGLKVVFAMVDLVTLGGAIAATKFSEMGLKEGPKAFGKTALIDFAGNTAACGVGALGEVLKQQGLTLEEFNKLRLTDVKDLTKEQIAQMKAIREAVPKIDANTYIQKTIPASDIDKYIGEDGWSTIGGYVARYDDVSHIKGYDNVVESSRLDYVTGDGVRPYPEGGDTYAYIKFKTTDAEKIKTPYGEIFGGTNTDGPPCTLNGFTGARNGQIIPEWSLSGEYVKPKKGAELHKVVNGKDTVVAIFDGKHFVEVKGK